jgi:hypothetical protein
VERVGAECGAAAAHHLHETARLRGATDARGDCANGRGHQLGGSRRTQPRGVMGKDLHVVAPAEAAGAAVPAVVLFAQGAVIPEMFAAECTGRSVTCVVTWAGRIPSSVSP